MMPSTDPAWTSAGIFGATNVANSARTQSAQGRRAMAVTPPPLPHSAFPCTQSPTPSRTPHALSYLRDRPRYGRPWAWQPLSLWVWAHPWAPPAWQPWHPGRPSCPVAWRAGRCQSRWTGGPPTASGDPAGQQSSPRVTDSGSARGKPRPFLPRHPSHQGPILTSSLCPMVSVASVWEVAMSDAPVFASVASSSLSVLSACDAACVHGEPHTFWVQEWQARCDTSPASPRGGRGCIPLLSEVCVCACHRRRKEELANTRLIHIY